MKSSRRWPRHTTYLCTTTALFLFLTFLAPSPFRLSSSSQGLVAAEGLSFFKKQAVPVPDPNQVAAKEQAIARLKALKSSSSSSSQQENTDDNASNSNRRNDNDKDSNNNDRKLRVSKGKGRGKGIEDLLNVVVAESSSNPLPADDNTSIDNNSNNDNNANTNDNSRINNDEHNTASDARSASSIDSAAASTEGQERGAADPAAIRRVLSPPSSSSSTPKKKKKAATGHEDDIIHEHDHADNDAYDDIVWYDGPHRDDEDEHGDGHDDHHDDHDDDHDDDDHHDEDHHDGEIHFDEDHHYDDEDHRNSNQDRSKAKQSEIGVNNYDDRVEGGTGSESLETTIGNMSTNKNNNNHLQQRILNADDNSNNPSMPSSYQHQHDYAKETGGGRDPMVFHHSGAEVLVGPISPVEFCLRLKHECESTCREFRSQVIHVSTTCAFGSVAELLLWGKCCQVGQTNRKKPSRARGHVQQQQQQPVAVQDSSSPSSPSSSSSRSGSNMSNEEEAAAKKRQEELAQEHLQLQQKRHTALLEHKKQLFLQQQDK
ncbi:hypothetical protein BGZ91_003906 [Linnemannia elongata]|nr:hypothetical protein BGZ91_003906 [Linnemannia elongata]